MVGDLVRANKRRAKLQQRLRDNAETQNTILPCEPPTLTDLWLIPRYRSQNHRTPSAINGPLSEDLQETSQGAILSCAGLLTALDTERKPHSDRWKLANRL